MHCVAVFCIFVGLLQGIASGEDECGEVHVPTTDSCLKEHGPCTADIYNNVRLVPLKSADCTEFCQCEHASTEQDGSVTYRWAKHDCPEGTLFDAGIKVCNHAVLVTC